MWCNAHTFFWPVRIIKLYLQRHTMDWDLFEVKITPISDHFSRPISWYAVTGWLSQENSSRIVSDVATRAYYKAKPSSERTVSHTQNYLLSGEKNILRELRSRDREFEELHLNNGEHLPTLFCIPNTKTQFVNCHYHGHRLELNGATKNTQFMEKDVSDSWRAQYNWKCRVVPLHKFNFEAVCGNHKLFRRWSTIALQW